jgi:NAD(P)-dependent dehydrogenase (short-subunit alcohol dehydrogenase family)
VVTGAAQGIGEYTARALASQGATLYLSDIQSEKVAAVAAELGMASGPADISDPKSAKAMIDDAIETLGGVDALLNIGGIDCPSVSCLEMDEAHWKQLIDTDLSGPWWVTRAVLPHMVERGSGKVVFISSICARNGDEGVSPAYSAAKAGLIGLVIQLSQEMEQKGVMVNAIAPGVIGTTGTPMEDNEIAEYEAAFALGVGGPKPVSDAIQYLLGESGDWISGAVMNVSGGFIRGC